MKRLVNRQQQIPNGFHFAIPEIKYNAAPYSSFDTIVNSVLRIVQANPAFSTQYGWPMDRKGVEDWVESAQCQICEINGWTKYITSGDSSPPPPKFKALSRLAPEQVAAAANVIKKVWQGVKTLNDWIDSNEPAVPKEQAEKRASICAVCPNNGQGGLESWFTRPAAAIIKKQFERLAERKLSTSQDSKLGTCTACLCPLPLLCQTPLKYKLAYMGEETRKSLHPSCWVISESKEQGK